jgi:SAM-dependent methyltransferase
VTHQPPASSTGYDVYDSLADFGELYDHVGLYAARTDIAFYVDIARTAQGPVVELGCGTGRVLLPAARAGVTITGVDRSRRMLERCQAKLDAEPDAVRARVDLHAGDIRSFNLDRRFALAMMPFRVLQHLVAVDEQLACLANVRRHLATGGRLVLDVFAPILSRIVSPPVGEQEDTPPTPLPNGRSLRRTARVVATHIAAQVNDIELIYYVTEADGRVDRRVQAFPMRWFLRFELEHLLVRSGFTIREMFGSFDRAAIAEGSPDIIVIAERH